MVDVIAVLTQSANPRRYWSDLKRKIAEDEGYIQLYENIVQLKLLASDGKSYSTDVTDMQNIFRIIQSIPSPKAEPFSIHSHPYGWFFLFSHKNQYFINFLLLLV